jgi:hypothetical protein
VPKSPSKPKSEDQTPTRFIPIDRLTRDPALQLRQFPGGGLTDPDHVAKLRELREDGVQWDTLPGVVTDGENFWLYSGFHRVQVDEDLGRGSVECDVTEGDYRDALLLALGVNTLSVLPRTQGCCLRAVNTLLDAPDLISRITAKLKPGDGGIQRAIARVCGVSNGTVTNALSARGLHTVQNKIEPITQRKPRSAPAQSGPDEDEADDTGHITGARLSGPRKKDDEDEPDDGPAWTATPPQPQHEMLAGAVAELVKRLEEYAEGPEGGWLFAQKDGHGNPFVVNGMGDKRGVVTAGEGWRSKGEMDTELALSHAKAVDPDRVQAFARCGWLRELAETLLTKRRKAA